MDANELKQAQANLRKKSEEKKEQSNRVADLLTAGKRIGSKPLKHTIAGFEFETVSVLSKDDRSKFLESVTNVEATDDGIEGVINKCAELMANICIDEDLKDKEVWIRFNDECGALIGMVHQMLQELVVSQEELKTVRKV